MPSLNRFGDARRLAPWVWPLLLLCACTSSPQDTAQQSAQSALSWTATAHLAGQAWIDRAVPDAYMRQTLEQARAGLDDEARMVAGLPSSAPTGPLGDRLHRVTQDTRRLAEVVGRGDRGAARPLVARLALHVAALRSLSARLKARP